MNLSWSYMFHRLYKDLIHTCLSPLKRKFMEIRKIRTIKIKIKAKIERMYRGVATSRAVPMCVPEKNSKVNKKKTKTRNDKDRDKEVNKG